MKEIPVIELFSLDTLENIAIVQSPAIEVDFLCFSKEKSYLFSANDKHILTGPFLIPEMRILRVDEHGNPFNVFFSKDTVEKIAYDFIGNDKIHAFNLGHNQNTDKLTLIESWVKTGNSDKSTELGIDVPIGTWLGSVKVNDYELWNEIKQGKYNGFSIAGLFTTERHNEEEELLAKIKQIILSYE